MAAIPIQDPPAAAAELEYHQAFLDLVDAAPVFDYIVDIMGP